MKLSVAEFDPEAFARTGEFMAKLAELDHGENYRGLPSLKRVEFSVGNWGRYRVTASRRSKYSSFKITKIVDREAK